MKIALLTIDSRSARPRVVLAALACAGLLGSAVAAPGGEPGRRDEAPPQQGQPHYGRDGRAFEPRAVDVRQADPHAADEQRRMAQSADTARRNNRLTPDERRDLRRQINEAGQDIYAAPPRR